MTSSLVFLLCGVPALRSSLAFPPNNLCLSRRCTGLSCGCLTRVRGLHVLWSSSPNKLLHSVGKRQAQLQAAVDRARRAIGPVGNCRSCSCWVFWTLLCVRIGMFMHRPCFLEYLRRLTEEILVALVTLFCGCVFQGATCQFQLDRSGNRVGNVSSLFLIPSMQRRSRPRTLQPRSLSGDASSLRTDDCSQYARTATPMTTRSRHITHDDIAEHNTQPRMIPRTTMTAQFLFHGHGAQIGPGTTL